MADLSRRSGVHRRGGTGRGCDDRTQSGRGRAGDAATHGAQHAPSLNFGDFPVVARVRARRALEHLQVLSDKIGLESLVQKANCAPRTTSRGCYAICDTRFRCSLQDRRQVPRFGPRGKDTWQTGSSPQGLQDATREGVVLDVGVGSNIPADVTGKIVFIGAVTNVADAYLTAAQRGAIAVLLGRIGADPLRRLSAFSPTLPTPVTIPVLGPRAGSDRAVT
ncbi:PA domain-containing protein [Kibdelosporangium philippinense]|uniref:PA domain-containing protein n=1 Tax=Kibdelosporangium philippinense TaxID=211113 RepID=UPI003607DE69